MVGYGQQAECPDKSKEGRKYKDTARDGRDIRLSKQTVWQPQASMARDNTTPKFLGGEFL